MKFKISLVLLSIIVISCKSKIFQENKTSLLQEQKEVNYIPYYLKVYKADSLYLIGNYERSYQILDSLFKKYEPLNLEKYKEYETYLACSFVLNKKDSLKYKFLRGIEKYGVNVRYIKYDTILQKAFKSCAISLEEIENCRKLYVKKLNFNLRDSIKLICKDDQEVRANGVVDYKKIKFMDSLNQIKLKNIFGQYIYPHEKLIGEFYIDSTEIDLRFVYLHTEDNFRINYLLPKILKAVKSGKAYPEWYSESLDRYYEEKFGKQLYGSYNLKRETSVTRVFNFKKIDSIRKSIGLPYPNYMRWRTKVKYGF